MTLEKCALLPSRKDASSSAVEAVRSSMITSTAAIDLRLALADWTGKHFPRRQLPRFDWCFAPRTKVLLVHK